MVREEADLLLSLNLSTSVEFVRIKLKILHEGFCSQEEGQDSSRSALLSRAPEKFTGVVEAESSYAGPVGKPTH